MQIRGHELEYIEDGHIYLVDGVIAPSITQMLQSKFGHKYDHVNEAVLNRAASAGTAVHEAIERYCKTGEETGIPELRGFKFLQRMYGFKVLENEVPVILFDHDEPIAAGRLDMVIEMNGEIGGADIKRTSTLDKEYLAYQLNLYRLAYLQSYRLEWTFLRGIHLREEKRKFVTIPICGGLMMDFIKEWRQNNEAS